MSLAAGAAHIARMDSTLTVPTPLVPDHPPYMDGPYEVDSRIFTPEAMDEYDDYMAEPAVEQLAA